MIGIIVIEPHRVFFLLVGLLCVLLCYLFYRWRDDTFTIPWMYVSTVDEEGNQVGKGRWVRIPDPDQIPENGLNHVIKYVARMVKSSSTRCSLIIATPDGDKACLIIKEDGQPKIYESVHLAPSSPTPKKVWPHVVVPPSEPEPEKEQAIRKLFAELNIAPVKDEVHDYNGYADARRSLIYPISNDIVEATRIIQRLLREVYHVRDEEGLNFTFEE